MTLLHGDNYELLKQMPDNSVDAVITDPPYGLGEAPDALAMLRDWLETGHHDVKSKRGFMGKTWDNFVPQPRVWREVFRVLKPGGHVLAFAGTRTQDLMALGLRLAGFEIRDLVAWVYGSGFPKSLDVSKALEAFAKTGRSDSQVTGDGRSRDQGQHFSEFRKGNAPKADFSPTTEAAKQWEGWGTALKPALEPITLARKPLEGTVAANVLKWHTGAINVDACRVHAEDAKEGRERHGGGVKFAEGASGFNQDAITTSPAGRWPANLIHDGSDEALGLFPESKGQQGVLKGHGSERQSPNGILGKFPPAKDAEPRNDSGSAARFFRCCPPETLELLFCRAKSILGAWKIENVNRVESSLLRQEQVVASVLSDAVIAASRGDKLLSDVRGLSMPVTADALEKLCETLITAMLISENAALPGPPQDALIQNGCRVSFVATQKPTDTMTITINLPTSDGYAEPVMFSIMPQNSDRGVKGSSANRFRYCPKVSPSERNAGLSDLPDKEWKADGAAIPQRADRPFKPSKNNHPTVKPIALMRYLCRLITPPGGTVLDPWMGSGSTGVACKEEGFQFTGMEQDMGYYLIACQRNKVELPEM